jgi:hypothetical protein
MNARNGDDTWSWFRGSRSSKMTQRHGGGRDSELWQLSSRAVESRNGQNDQGEARRRSSVLSPDDGGDGDGDGDDFLVKSSDVPRI